MLSYCVRCTHRRTTLALLLALGRGLGHRRGHVESHVTRRLWKRRCVSLLMMMSRGGRRSGESEGFAGVLWAAGKTEAQAGKRTVSR